MFGIEEKSLPAAIAIVIVDRNMRRVVRMSDRACVLRPGRIPAQGDAAQSLGS